VTVVYTTIFFPLNARLRKKKIVCFLGLGVGVKIFLGVGGRTRAKPGGCTSYIIYYRCVKLSYKLLFFFEYYNGLLSFCVLTCLRQKYTPEYCFVKTRTVQCST
jgi:hypothetical protein